MSEEESNNTSPALYSFLGFSLISAIWALYLVQVHNDAVAQQLDPSLLCGPEGGCGAVLASEWSTIFGIAVSAPAVPLYALLFVMGLQGLSQKVSRERIASLGGFCAFGGLLFGLYLLYHMIFSVEQICRYCLIMDGLNLGVLISAIFLHPKGLIGIFDVGSISKNVFSPNIEGGLIPALLIGTFLITEILPEPQMDAKAKDAAVAEALKAIEEQTPKVETKKETPKKAPTKATPQTTSDEKEGMKTKRVVLNDKIEEIPLDASVPQKGPKNAPITIILFEDFQCPYCRKLTANIEGLIQQRPEDVRVAWYNFPMHTDCNKTGLKKDMHPRACVAAKASHCAHEQQKFWPMHDILFQRSAKLSNTDILKYADEIGLNKDTFVSCMKSAKTQAKIEKDAQIGSEHGVSGTPNFFVNGRKLAGAQPIEALVAVVDALKAKEQEGRILLDVEVQEEVIGTVEGAASTVRVDGPYGKFEIDAFEASVVDGKALSQAGLEPTRNISWFDAQKSCEAVGKRLCTEEEWLSACTGVVAKDANGDGIYSDDMKGRKHPYGSEWQQSSYCASHRRPGDKKSILTGNHPKCVTPEGVYDLEGLSKEWVGAYPHKAGTKGGSMYSGPSARCGYFKANAAPTAVEDTTGFRCCKGDLPADPTADQYKGGKVGDTALTWDLPDMNKDLVSFSSYEGKAVIQTFWATWCGPCRKELPVLAELYEKYKDQGLIVVGINVDTDPRKVKAFLKQTPLPFDVVLDTDSAIHKQFDATSVPATYWINTKGQIERKTVGYDERKKKELDKYVQSLLKK